ncbi:DUF1015 domain-containing protein [bacterium]|nr:DUF1015 domain-containing protein [bacterium]
MARIFPFRGVMYRKDDQDLTELVSQPYDKINDKMQAEYYERSEYNIVRLIKGKATPEDTPENNQYTRASDFLRKWMADGILVRDSQPAIYIYYQKYKVEGELKTRKGFVALAALEAPGEEVKAHEHTLAGPKADRLNLMRTTASNFGHIFMLYADPQNQINQILDEYAEVNPPLFTANDYYGENHQLWRLTDPLKIGQIQKLMRDKVLFIADGHHRYETAVNYMKEMKAQNKPIAEGAENYTNLMMTFVNMDGKGLSILPTHRVVHSVQNFDPEGFLARVSQNFNIEEIPFEPAVYDYKKNEFIYKLTERGKDEHVFGLAMKNQNKFWLLSLKSESLMDNAVKGEHSKQWKTLDVSILHSLLLDDLLGIDARALEEKRNIDYIRHFDEGFDCINEDPKVQMVFFINPTKVEQVKEIASRGERMPQKSTDFYPKLLTGMVINVMIQ